MGLSTNLSARARSLNNPVSAIIALLFGVAVLVLPFKWPWNTGRGGENPLLTRPAVEYRQAISKALGARSDHLQDWFRVVGTTQLQAHLTHIAQIVFSGNRIAVLDNFEPGIYLFSSQGKLEQRIGQKGPSPGQYIDPSGITFGPGFIAVADFTVKRVSLFDFSGNLIGSFVYGPEMFSADGIVFDNQSNQFILFGNRWPHQADKSRILFVHRYERDGEFVGSAFQLPLRAVSLNFEAFDTPLVEANEIDGEPIRFMLPWDGNLYSLSGGGKPAIAFDDRGQLEFRPPSSPLKLEPPSLAAVQRWMLSWTPIVGFASDSEKLLVEKQCFCPARYRLQIWSLANRTLIGSFGTNLWLIGRGHPGTFMFLEGFPDQPKDSEHEILETQLRAR